MAMQAFFKTNEPPLAKATTKGRTNRRNTGAGGCEACGLYKTCNSPKMEATGEGKLGILVLAEAPGKKEDELGVQLIGKSGQRLREELSRVGIDLDVDCRKMNAINCRPQKNKTPSDKEIAFCRHRVMAEIKEFKPKIILALGGPAMKSLVQHRAVWDRGVPGINIWQGACIPDQDLGAWVIPTWHPAFIERISGEQDNYPVYLRKWRADFKMLSEMVDSSPPKTNDYPSKVEVIVSPTAAAQRLKELYRHLLDDPESFVSFDYETTGKKPYAEGHEIYCASLAWDDDKAISFLTTSETWPWLARILRSKKIRKTAHNMKFEQLWSRIRALPKGFDVECLDWCSLLGAFVLDNRTGRNGLKLQAYLEFGVLGYDDATAEFIKSDDKSANAFNRVKEAPVRDLLLYCGMDSLLQWRLAMIQIPQIAADEGLSAAYNLFHEGALALVDAEINGIRVDTEYFHKQSAHLERRIAHLRKHMLDYPEVQKWRDMNGVNYNLNSGPQLAKLLTALGLEPENKTKSGGISTNKEALEDIDLPFIKDLLQIRKLEKIKGTYVAAYITEATDGIVHPFYNLHKVVSYRGSCDSPNFQNVPKRDKEAQKIVRRGFLPSEGMLWGEVDYSAIEVKISTSYHCDPNMLEYQHNPKSDMHRDAAAKLFMLIAEKVTKDLRQGGKNGFIFPQFYGDYWGNNAPHLWNDWVLHPINGKLADGTHIKQHLAKCGIRNLTQFAKHVRKVEYWLWHDRFPVYKQWREDHWEEYLATGSFRGHVGFNYTGIMGRNDAINYGTQGSAFHCLLWSFTRINERLKKEGWRSYLIGQIHDCIDLCIAPEEINELLPMLRKIMVDDLMAHYTWINCPMDIEMELAPLGKSWFDVSEVKHRQHACECGLEWGYSKKQENGSIRWTCPVCEHFEVR